MWFQYRIHIFILHKKGALLELVRDRMISGMMDVFNMNLWSVRRNIFSLIDGVIIEKVGATRRVK